MRLFRAAALARFQSPEQLDELMTAASPRSWLGLVTLITLLAVLTAWGFLGAVRTTVTGHGLLLRPGGVFNVRALGEGLVTAVHVSPGDTVTKGQEIARIAQPTLEMEVESTRAQLVDSRQAHARTLELYDEGDERYRTLLSEQRKGIQSSIDFLRERLTANAKLLERSRQALERQQQQLHTTQESLLARVEASRNAAARLESLQKSRAVAFREMDTALEERENRDERLRQTGVELSKLEVTRLQTETAATKESDQIKESMQALTNQLAGLAREEVERTTRRREELFSRSQDVRNLENKLALLERRLDLLSSVKSAYAGTIVEVMATPGHVLGVGSPVASGELLEKSLEVALFVPAQEGKKIEPGMKMEVTPSTVKREEFGYIVGTVRTVIAYPASDEAMLRLIPNHAIVAELRKGGVCVQIVGEMLADPSSPSGFRWSSGKGPDLRVHSGTLCEGGVTVREQPPVTLVIPALRKVLGVD